MLRLNYLPQLYFQFKKTWSNKINVYVECYNVKENKFDLSLYDCMCFITATGIRTGRNDVFYPPIGPRPDPNSTKLFNYLKLVNFFHKI